MADFPPEFDGCIEEGVCHGGACWLAGNESCVVEGDVGTFWHPKVNEEDRVGVDGF